MPSIHWRDSIGSALITTPAYTFANWTPDAEDIGDRATGLGTGTEYLFGFRVDYVVHLEMSHIPPLALGDLMRLKRHLLNGGLITVFTDDAASRVYTCSLKPGSTPSWTLADRVNLEYTLTLELRHVAPVPLLCDYSAVKGATSNLIVNGGGESGTEGQMAPNWTLEVGAIRSTDLLTPTSGEALFDSRSLTRTAVDPKTSIATQTRTLIVGQRYLLSGWVKMTAIAAGTKDSTWPHGVGLAVGAGGIGYTRLWRSGDSIRADSATGYPGVMLRANGAARDWTYIATLILVSSTPTSTAMFIASAMDAGQVWLDGVRLEPVPAA